MDRDRYLLSQGQAERVFVEDIVPERLVGVAQQQPVVVFVVGQPGAGKSYAQAAVLAQLGRAHAVTIDVDDLRTYHPQYERLALSDDRTAAAYTQRDAQRWLRMSIADAIHRRYDVVLSTTFADADNAQALIERFHAAGYPVQVVILAVHEVHSRLGVLERYQADRTTFGYGRYTPPEYQHTAYTGLLGTADRIDHLRLADAVYVYQRDGQQIYHNELINDEWRDPPASRAAVEHARNISLSTDTGQLLVRSTALSRTLSADLRPDAAAILVHAATLLRDRIHDLNHQTARRAESHTVGTADWTSTPIRHPPATLAAAVDESGTAVSQQVIAGFRSTDSEEPELGH